MRQLVREIRAVVLAAAGLIVLAGVIGALTH